MSLLPIVAQTVLSNEDYPDKDANQVPEVKPSEEVKPEHIIDKHKTSPTEAVVDLHIQELVDRHDQMENSEIIKIQINYFTSCLENAMANRLKKVTFIHGVGTGVLKTAIKEILKDYPNVSYRDASMKDFGYGAMDVTLR